MFPSTVIIEQRSRANGSVEAAGDGVSERISHHRSVCPTTIYTMERYNSESGVQIVVTHLGTLRIDAVRKYEAAERQRWHDAADNFCTVNR